MPININGTTGISGVDGSAGTPGIQGSDPNTGIFFPAADTIAFSEGGIEVMRLDSSANLQFNSGYGSAATAYGCRAWVNFNGTGTPAVRASGNVSSITDNGTGDYTVNFTTAMSDVNYCVVTQGTSSGKGYTVNAPKNAVSGNITTTAITMITADFNGTTSDLEYMFVAIFR